MHKYIHEIVTVYAFIFGDLQGVLLQFMHSYLAIYRVYLQMKSIVIVQFCVVFAKSAWAAFVLRTLAVPGTYTATDREGKAFGDQLHLNNGPLFILIMNISP